MDRDEIVIALAAAGVAGGVVFLFDRHVMMNRWKKRARRNITEMIRDDAKLNEALDRAIQTKAVDIEFGRIIRNL